MDVDEKDSPLSVTANIAGILTFLVAIVATVYARITYLRNSDQEYFRVKTSLSWYKTESTWLAELVKASAPPPLPARTSTSLFRRSAFEKKRGNDDTECSDDEFLGGGTDGEVNNRELKQEWRERNWVPESPGRRAEYEMYTFVMDDLLKLEQRLLELIEETELRAANGSGQQSSLEGDNRGEKSWTLVPTWGWTTPVALAWLPVRSKALELVRQRDALTARVSFTQMSMISSRISDLEHRGRARELVVDGTLKKLEAIIQHQNGEIHRLEDKIYRIMHRGRVGGDSGATLDADGRSY